MLKQRATNLPMLSSHGIFSVCIETHQKYTVGALKHESNNRLSYSVKQHNYSNAMILNAGRSSLFSSSANQSPRRGRVRPAGDGVQKVDLWNQWKIYEQKHTLFKDLRNWQDNWNIANDPTPKKIYGTGALWSNRDPTPKRDIEPNQKGFE